jgi:hypothetical protein
VGELGRLLRHGLDGANQLVERRNRAADHVLPGRVQLVQGSAEDRRVRLLPLLNRVDAGGREVK